MPVLKCMHLEWSQDLGYDRSQFKCRVCVHEGFSAMQSVKAYLRRGTAREFLGYYKDANEGQSHLPPTSLFLCSHRQILSLALCLEWLFPCLFRSWFTCRGLKSCELFPLFFIVKTHEIRKRKLLYSFVLSLLTSTNLPGVYTKSLVLWGWSLLHKLLQVVVAICFKVERKFLGFPRILLLYKCQDTQKAITGVTLHHYPPISITT